MYNSKINTEINVLAEQAASKAAPTTKAFVKQAVRLRIHGLIGLLDMIQLGQRQLLLAGRRYSDNPEKVLLEQMLERAGVELTWLFNLNSDFVAKLTQARGMTYNGRPMDEFIYAKTGESYYTGFLESDFMTTDGRRHVIGFTAISTNYIAVNDVQSYTAEELAKIQQPHMPKWLRNAAMRVELKRLNLQKVKQK